MKLINQYLKLNSFGRGYTRHQSDRERARRIRQVLTGRLQMAGTQEIIEAHWQKWQERWVA